MKLETKDISYLLFSNYDMPFSIWEKVIKAYCTKFTNYDSVTLIVYIKNTSNAQNEINLIEDITKLFPECPDILVLNENVYDERLLFMQANYFITTRDVNTVRWTTYADEYGVKLPSGVDIPIF